MDGKRPRWEETSASQGEVTRPMVRKSASPRRRLGAAIGGGLGSSLLALLLLPANAHFSAPGRMNSGHETLTCDGCHRPAPGSVRQQLQANARFLLGLRARPVDFGERAVGNEDCLACHERPFDRHPVFRFREPRFAEARRAIAPHQCGSCHREHSGVRVSAPNGYCVNCHAELALRDDPLDVSHRELAERDSWNSCLGCHDYHGNHQLEPATALSGAASQQQLERYFKGGASPYPDKLRKRALQLRLDHER
jgi:uncharacterized CHY-type Zn-finger protein